MTESNRALRAAAMLVQALEIDTDPFELAASGVTLRADPHASTFAFELETMAGAAAFLTYVYDLATRAGDGRTGRQHFAADIATLEIAAERGTPGPRLLAHASTDAEGFVLATTPATYRILAGEAPVAPDAMNETIARLLPESDLIAHRRRAASELLTLLRAAEGQASAWLGALSVLGGAGEAAPPTGLTFLEEESELALYLLDDRSIQNLLRSLNLLIETARAGASA